METFAARRFHTIAWSAHLAMQSLRVILNIEKEGLNEFRVVEKDSRLKSF